MNNLAFEHGLSYLILPDRPILGSYYFQRLLKILFDADPDEASWYLMPIAWAGLEWRVVGFPAGKIGLVKEAAKEAGLTITEKIPIAVLKGETHEFIRFEGSIKVFMLGAGKTKPRFKNRDNEMEEMMKLSRKADLSNQVLVAYM